MSSFSFLNNIKLNNKNISAYFSLKNNIIYMSLLLLFLETYYIYKIKNNNKKLLNDLQKQRNEERSGRIISQQKLRNYIENNNVLLGKLKKK
jgi:hypothetical protein